MQRRKTKRSTMDFLRFFCVLHSNQSPPPSFFHLLSLDSFFFFFFFFFLKRQNKRHRGNKKKKREKRETPIFAQKKKKKKKKKRRWSIPSPPMGGTAFFLPFCLFFVVVSFFRVACGEKDANPYAILGVDKTADASAIKRSYRKLSLRFHPDKQQHNDEEQKEKIELSVHSAKLCKSIEFSGSLLPAR